MIRGKDFLTPKKYPIDYKEKLDDVFEWIKNSGGVSNLVKVDFTDVGAKGIQIRGFHKDARGRYVYGHQSTILYDFSNIKDAADEFVKMWIKNDNDEAVKSHNAMIADGEKYGWD